MNTAITLQQPRRSISVFGPIVLIGVGIIWLMANQGLVHQNLLEALIRFWPLFLIIGGVQLLVSQTGFVGTLVSAVLGIALVLGAIFYLTLPGEIVTPTWFNLNLVPGLVPTQTTDLGQPLDNTRALRAELRLPGGFLTLKPTTNPVNLMEGQASYLGALTNRLTRSGDTATLLLANTARNNNNWLDFAASTQQWDIRLNPQVPLDLDVQLGSGVHEFDLRAFALKSLRLEQGSGAATFRLPSVGKYDLNLNVGSGMTTIVLPPGMPARVQYDIGSGWMNINRLQRVSGTDKYGVYETEGFTQDGAYVNIHLEMGSGLVIIQ